MIDLLLPYLSIDRLHALAGGSTVPARSSGAVFFGDLSGFTPLAEELTRCLGPHRGAEEVAQQINAVYDALLPIVHLYGGSVIGFAGDSVTCYFDQDEGARAVACALAMQDAMGAFQAVALPTGESIALGLKVGISVGWVRRFLVGDPQTQHLEVLAGTPLVQMAQAEQWATRGEVLLEGATARRLAERGVLQISAWRGVTEGEAGYAVVAALGEEVSTCPWGDIDRTLLSEEMLRAWVLPTVYERVQGEFLTELRPVVALFLRFSGIDYDHDETAGVKLDQLVCLAQRVASDYGGTLIDVTLGDKGSYLYLAFGVPHTHENDAERAILAAQTLRTLTTKLPFIHPLQMGISQGTMRVGAYGGSTRRTYGALGDEVNVAARLMQAATPGQILVTGRVQNAVGASCYWSALAPLSVKGKRAPIAVFALEAVPRQTSHGIWELYHQSPLVGREAELAQIEACLSRACLGEGQVVGLVGQAGIGKSRLLAAVVERATKRGILCLGGGCQSYGSNIAYLVWQSIWRAFFGLREEGTLDQQQNELREALARLDPTFPFRLPLLGTVLGVEFPDNELTQLFPPVFRKASREALLVDCLKARASHTPLLLVLEDIHWLDELSHDLLEAVGRAISNLPVLVLLTYRSPELPRLQVPRLSKLPHFSELSLQELAPREAEQLILCYLDMAPGEEEGARELVRRVLARAGGNPFYIEELLLYLQLQRAALGTGVVVGELPSSLESLILSHLDQLQTGAQLTLKVASIIGREFRAAWLWGYYPLGEEASVRATLAALAQTSLVVEEQPEPDLLYLFKHVLTQEVIYESLPYALRTRLHEQLARFLETTFVQALPLALLAYHYERSANLSKQCEYLERAGRAAQLAYANTAALEYYQQLLPLVSEGERQGRVLFWLGEVVELLGQWEEARGYYQQALDLAQAARQDTPSEDGAWAIPLMATCQRAIGGVLSKQGHYATARSWLEEARVAFETLGDAVGLSQVLTEIARTFWNQADYPVATDLLQQSLTFATQSGDSHRMGQTLRELGNVAFLRGEYGLARIHYEESGRMASTAGHQLNLAPVLCNLGLVAYTYEADFGRARMLYEESLALARKVGDKNLIATLLVNLGVMLTHQAQYAEGEKFLREGLTIVREIDERRHQANALVNLGANLSAQSKFEAAHAALEAGLALAQQIGAKWDIVLGHANLGKMAYLQRDYDLAERYLTEGLTRGREIGVQRNITQILSNLGLVALQREDFLGAKQYLEESLVIAQEIGRQQQVLQTLSGLVGLAFRAAPKPYGVAEEVAKMLGLVEAKVKTLGIPLEATYQGWFDHLVQEVRGALGESTFVSAWEEGATMQVDEAISAALALIAASLGLPTVGRKKKV